MIVTRKEFESDPGRYLDLLGEEEIVITADGKFLGKLIGAKSKILDSLVGIIPDDGTIVDKQDIRRVRAEEVMKKYERIGR